MDSTVTHASSTVYAVSAPFSGLRRLSEPVALTPSPGNGKHESSPLLYTKDGLPSPGALHTIKETGNDSTFSSTGGHAILAETSYCLVSAGTILFNKHTLSSFGFPAPNALLLFQFLQAVVMLQAAHTMGLLHLDRLRWETVKTWMPVNLVFVAMNVTGFYALRSIGAGTFTVLKNLSNVLIIAGDGYFFGKTYTWHVHACLAVMILSAALGAWTDVSFKAEGYAWQLLNCLFTATYTLYLSSVIRKAKADTTAGAEHGKLPLTDPDSGPTRFPQLTEVQMVYYNNVLSLLPCAVLVLCFNEVGPLLRYDMYWRWEFQLIALVGGLLGFSVSFASIWCMSRTSATMFSLTGSMNKVVVAAVGMWLFNEPMEALNLVSVGMGLIAGMLFVLAKQK